MNSIQSSVFSLWCAQNRENTQSKENHFISLSPSFPELTHIKGFVIIIVLKKCKSMHSLEQNKPLWTVDNVTTWCSEQRLQRSASMQSPGGKEPLWPSVRGLRTSSSKEKAHNSKVCWHLNTVYVVSWWITVQSCQDKNDYKMADKGHLRTRKDYSSEVLEPTCKTMRLTVPSPWGEHIKD